MTQSSAIDFSQMPTLGDIARYHARERPGAVALAFEGRDTSFADFDRRSDQVANALLAEGLTKGRRIAYIGKNSDHYFERLFGAAKMGAVMTPIGWRLAPPEDAYIVGDADAPLLFVGPDVIGHAEEVARLLPQGLKIIAMEPGEHPHRLFEAWRDTAPVTPPPVAIEPSDIAVQLYTSGATGKPKGAMLSHHNLLSGRRAAAEAGMEWNGWGPDDVSLVAMPGVELKIIDEAGNTLPPNRVGEVATRSVANMPGYWKLPEATASTIDAEGWLRTGDAGYLDEDGYLYIHDRVKDMIITGAENVYPAEVESAIHGHPDVAEVAVIGIPDEKWGEAVKAVVALKPGASPDPASIIAFARTRIAAFKVPKSVDFIDALPRNASGKILRKDLREPYWAGRTRRVN